MPEIRSGGQGSYHWIAALNGSCYHRSDCWRLRRIDLNEMLGFPSREDAWLFGFEPCRCVKRGGEKLPDKTRPASYASDAARLKRSFDFPYYGNVKSLEVHRSPCKRRVARNIPVASRIGFRNLEEAHSLGFDNCYYCIGNSLR